MTIQRVDVVAAGHIVVANDSNRPYSSGRWEIRGRSQ
jgi:hypothetical protein